MRIDHLYRYPVKGLTAEALEEVALAPGEILPWDRAFALAQGDAPFDAAAPRWIRKSHFLCLAANPGAAALRSVYDPRSGVLAIRDPEGGVIAENALDPQGQARLAAWLAAWLQPERRGEPRFLHVPGHRFIDDDRRVVSLIGAASLRALEAAAGGARHHLRFRANVYFSGAGPWAEFDWVGREVQIGGARMRIVDRIKRCVATEVNPATATRDAPVVEELQRNFGHPFMGVYGEVIEGGRVAVGDAVEVMGGDI